MDLALKYIGNQCLTTPSKTIDIIDDSIINLAESMIVKMSEWNGIGLAAPQVGRNLRLIVIKFSTGKSEVMINPRISWTSETRVNMAEGCLSIPDKTIWVERPSKVRVKFQTIKGEFKYWCLSKMDARIFLHEYDHLEGILMTERQ